MKKLSLVLMLMILAITAFAGSTPSTSEVMAKASATAKSQGKNVLVIFHASWCGWCKKLDAFLEDDDMKALMNKNFVIVHLDVLEQPDKASLENPGGEELMAKLNGAEAGLPFTAVVKPNGTMVINSNAEKKGAAGNVGYPAAPQEIAHFMEMLKQGAPKMSAADRERIGKWLKDNAPKQ